MNTFNPLVSIVIPVYNGSNYMGEAIDSALAQTYKNIEIIVVNDGSKDNTEETALSYGDKIRYYKKENGGQSTALNFGIDKMQGEYFSWLSHDDVYYPEKVERQIEALSEIENKNTVLYSNCDLIDGDSKILRRSIMKDHDSTQIRFLLLKSSPINGCTALIKKTLFYQISKFNTKHPHTSDVELFFDFAETVPFVFMNECLIMSRSHQQQMTNIKRGYHLMESNIFFINSLKKYEETEMCKLENKDIIYTQLCLYWSSRGFSEAYKYSVRKIKNKKTKFLIIIRSNFLMLKRYTKKLLK